MQNRNFDIAGPNPTPEEQKKIDEAYIAYLENERRSSIAAAFAKQQQQIQPPPKVEPTSLLGSAAAKVPVPVASPVKQQSTPKMRAGKCTKNSFSCEWPRLSAGINDLKKLLTGPPPSKDKAKRS